MANSQQPLDKKSPPTKFEQQANQAESGLVAEFVDFLMHSKKWWLTPIIVVLLLIGGLILLSGSVAAPFIYSLF